MSMRFYLVLQTLHFDDHLACNSAPSEGFTLLREDKLECLNLSFFCLNCFKLPDLIHNHEYHPLAHADSEGNQPQNFCVHGCLCSVDCIGCVPSIWWG
jgi:hypothetical protein